LIFPKGQLLSHSNIATQHAAGLPSATKKGFIMTLCMAIKFIRGVILMSNSSHIQSAFTDAVLHAKPVHIETPRLILRETQASDLDAFRDITTRPGFYYYCFDGSDNKLHDFINESIKTQSPRQTSGLRAKS
jgi:hypothetical protein